LGNDPTSKQEIIEVATTIKIDPVTRIEGHLAIEVTIDTVQGVQQVISARSSGTMFRGFEKILLNRDPRDATHITQRICGVCPVSHSLASAETLERAFGVTVPANGRVLRNLILGANFVQSHILHFYHLAALDYINTVGILDIAPWSSRYVSSDMVTGATAQALVGHYVEALAMRRKAHQMGAMFGGRLPCPATIVAGGCTEQVTSANIAAFRTLLTELRAFIDNVYLPDVLAVAGAFPQYYSIGYGSGNLMAYGVFDLDSAGTTKLLKRGRITGGVAASVNTAAIDEDVAYSYYSSASGLNPAVGETEHFADKAGAYSWIKAPRYSGMTHEVGPLARMFVNGDYTHGISVIDRVAARAFEAKKVADAMDGWLNSLVVGGSTIVATTVPVTATGYGLTEAPRGALGHWMDISASKISRYQVITPTAWNASPMDDAGQPGPIELALTDTPVRNIAVPIEVLRVIHSFDPCLSCAVHMVRPGSRKVEAVIPVQTGV
jgi:hydrogenase large subunit